MELTELFKRNLAELFKNGYKYFQGFYGKRRHNMGRHEKVENKTRAEKMQISI